MRRFVLVMLVVAGLVWSYNAGLETGLRNKPEFAIEDYDETSCGNIERREFGLVCEVRIQYEDDDIRVFRPKLAESEQ